MSQDTPRSPASTDLDPFRMQVFRARRQLIKSLSVETYDQGHVMYPCPHCGDPVVVVDAFPGVPAEGPVEVFIEGLKARWWGLRDHLEEARCESCGAEGPLEAAAGLYCRFMGDSGFDWAVELSGDEAVRCWRVDARGQAVELDVPEGELMFRDQIGAFFDLRSGWRTLASGVLSADAPAALEVQPGYVIGARPGDPDDPDPASREDEALQEILGHSAPRRYDTLEFLGRADDPLELLGAEEGPVAWLGEAGEAVADGSLEIFVLADAHRMLAAVEELAEVYGVDVSTEMEGEALEEAGIRLRFEASPVFQSLPFDAFYLRTLHAGMTFSEGASAWFGAAIRAVSEGQQVIQSLAEHLGDGWTVSVEDGATLVIAGEGGESRWPLMTLVGRATEGIEALLALLGFDEARGVFRQGGDDLARCPVTGAPARVGKIIRPLELLGVDPRTLAGVIIGRHVVVYTLEGPTHTTMLEADPRRDLQRLEQAYQEGLPEAHLEILALRKIALDTAESAPWLLVAAEAGSLVLEPGRLHQALGGAGVPGGEIAALDHAYGFFPDALILSKGALDPRSLRALRRSAHEAIRGLFPGRDWPLAVARPVKLSVPPVGRSTLAGSDEL